MIKNQLILFGAGKNGISALKKYKLKNIAYFCDNSTQKQGTIINGVFVISFEKMLSLYHEGYTIMVTPSDNVCMIGQLELNGVYDYLIFRDNNIRFPLQSLEEEEKKYASGNSILDDLVAKTEENDLLNDISCFAQLSLKALKMHKESDLILAYRGIGKGESYFYGNLQSLIHYAGIKETEIKYYPVVSHQGCMLLYTTSFQYKSAVIMQGEYYKNKIHQRAPYVPVFSIGPYIHYVEGIYSADKLKKEKEKYGKTLLVFLPHTIESIERKYSRQAFIDNVLWEYSDRFQSIWCCVYWADINNPICEYMEKKGIHIVSAGFRFDHQFNRRLKTILELSDAVVVGDIGTFVAYALYMGKPVGRIEIDNKNPIFISESRSALEKKLQMLDQEVYETQFYKIFSREIKNTDEQKQWMNKICGFDQIKDAEYIQKIFDITKDIWQQCGGDLFQYPEAVRKVYSTYDKYMEFNKMAILKAAVGAYID